MARDTNSKHKPRNSEPPPQSCLKNSVKLARKELRKWMPQGIDVQVPSLTSPGTEQLEADDVMALARESNDFLPDCVST